MTKQELEKLIDNLNENIPDRLSGNEANEILANQLSYIVKTERMILVSLLSDWINVRIPQKIRMAGDGIKEGRMWLALEMAEKYSLSELKPDIVCLLDDVHIGKTYLPYYIEMIERHLKKI